MQLLVAVASVVAAAALAGGLYWALHALVTRFAPDRAQVRWLPYVFLGPAIALAALLLIAPTIRTLWLSFTTRNSDGEDVWIGFGNYRQLFGQGGLWGVLGNNVLWIAIVPPVAVGLGLLIALLADRVGGRLESFFKSIIFMPMAISFVAAATIWSFVYASNPVGQTQVGLLNALRVAAGDDPVNWLQTQTGSLNDVLLMVPVVWLQTGFAMVLLSAAIKGVPFDTIEASRIDGANRFQSFWWVIVPQIRGTILAVFITIMITVMKIFDIVYAMGGGAFGTSVLGMEFFKQYFKNNNPGRASAVVVILLIAVLPVIFYQVRTYRKQQALA